MNIKTVLTWAAIAFVIWWVIQDPAGVPHLVSNIGGSINAAAHGFSYFIATI